METERKSGIWKRFLIGMCLGVLPIPICAIIVAGGDGSYSPMALFYGPIVLAISGRALIAAPFIYGCYALAIRSAKSLRRQYAIFAMINIVHFLSLMAVIETGDRPYVYRLIMNYPMQIALAGVVLFVVEIASIIAIHFATLDDGQS